MLRHVSTLQYDFATRTLYFVQIHTPEGSIILHHQSVSCHFRDNACRRKWKHFLHLLSRSALDDRASPEIVTASFKKKIRYNRKLLYRFTHRLICSLQYIYLIYPLVRCHTYSYRNRLFHYDIVKLIALCSRKLL